MGRKQGNKEGHAEEEDRPDLIREDALRGGFPASSHQDVIQTLDRDLFVIVVLGCHGQLAVLALDHLDRGEIGVHFDSLALELPLGVFTRLWVKACRGTHAETNRQRKIQALSS